MCVFSLTPSPLHSSFQQSTMGNCVPLRHLAILTLFFFLAKSRSISICFCNKHTNTQFAGSYTKTTTQMKVKLHHSADEFQQEPLFASSSGSALSQMKVTGGRRFYWEESELCNDFTFRTVVHDYMLTSDSHCRDAAFSWCGSLAFLHLKEMTNGDGKRWHIRGFDKASKTYDETPELNPESGTGWDLASSEVRRGWLILPPPLSLPHIATYRTPTLPLGFPRA